MNKKINYIIFTICSMAIISCNSADSPTTPSKITSIEQISLLEKQLYSDTVSVFNKATAGNLIAEYVKFTREFPDADSTADYLFKAAELCFSLKRAKQAINYFDQVAGKYPNYKKAPHCLFLKAFIYDEQLKDFENAGQFYKAFIDKYPDHDLADDAQFSIDNLGKSDEELIRQFEQRIAEQEKAEQSGNDNQGSK